MRDPSVGGALGAGLRALARQAWLTPLGMAVALARGALALPAAVFAAAASALAFRAALASGRTPSEGVLLAFAGVWASPRARAIALGLWLAGWLLWGALRAAWIAGALSALGHALSGRPGDQPAFAAGVAYRFDRVAVAAVAALLLDVAGQAMVSASAVAAVALIPAARAASSRAALAAVAAIAILASMFLAASLSVVGDAAVARAAMAGDPPGRALARAAWAVARRPAAFLAASLAVSLATVLAAGSLESLFGVMASAAAGAPRALLVAPQFLLGALSALLAAAAELWRLSAVGVLALGDEAGVTDAPVGGAAAAGPASR